MDEYDAIVIGSGMGGLTCATLLAKLAGKRVLVVEKHWTFGGLTHSFSRTGGFHWDVGLHYVGGMGQQAFTRKLMDYVTGGQVQWQALPEPFERFVFPDFTLEQGHEPQAYAMQLVRRFPQETNAIHQYFQDVKRAVGWFQRDTLARISPAWLRGLLRGYNQFSRALALQTTGHYLEQHICDPKLRAVLAAQWGDYGVSPYRSAFAIHALIVDHYLDGAWFPVGGSSALALAVQRNLESYRVRWLNHTEVTELLVEQGRAVGIVTRTPPQNSAAAPGPTRTYHAPLIFSAIGAYETYHRWLRQYVTDTNVWGDLQRMNGGESCVILYLGLSADPRQLGVQGENYWIFSDYDLANEDNAERALLAGQARQAFVSFSSQNNPQAHRHSAQIIAFIHFEAFRTWAERPWRNRGETYEQLKQTISHGLLALAERHIPGLRQLVEYQELATPLTLTSFTSRHRGTLYGLSATPLRYRSQWLTPRTPLPGLYLSGSDVSACGVVGALTGGISAVMATGQVGWWQLFRALRSRA